MNEKLETLKATMERLWNEERELAKKEREIANQYAEARKEYRLYKLSLTDEKEIISSCDYGCDCSICPINHFNHEMGCNSEYDPKAMTLKEWRENYPEVLRNGYVKIKK